MNKALLTAVAAIAAMIMTGCSSVNYPQQKNNIIAYHLNIAPKPYQPGNLASAKYKAYVAPYEVNAELYGKQGYGAVNYTEFIKAALAGKFGANLAFVDHEEHANIIVDLKSIVDAFDMESSVFLYLTARVNGILVTAKGAVYYRRPHWPPTTDNVTTAIEAAADSLVSLLKEMPDGTIGVAPLSIFEDKDVSYFTERSGVPVMHGPLGYNVEKRVEVD